MTNQTKSGALKSWVDEKSGELDRILAEYHQKLGLGTTLPHNEVQHFLNLSLAELKKLHAIEIAEASVVVNQEAAHIQIQINNEQARVRWATEAITNIIAGKITEYGTQYTPFEYRRAMAIKDDEALLKLESIRIQAQARLDSMLYVTNQLRQLATSLDKLQEVKRYRHGENIRNFESSR